MSASHSSPVPSSPAARPVGRVEYVGFQNVGERRVFRLHVHHADGSTLEFRFGIAITAFGAGRLSLQDGPDVCYQKLLRAMADGETAGSGVIPIDDVELAGYREAHRPAPKRKSRPPVARPPAAHVPPRPQTRTYAPQRSVPPPPAAAPAPRYQEGQRVGHATYGVGVTAASNPGHTTVRFDKGGTKTFVTSMLEIDVLSAPHTWETTSRGVNRPRK